VWKIQREVMAKALRTLYVKGDQEKKVLGDCPFCHRTLLTLELKVCFQIFCEPCWKSQVFALWPSNLPVARFFTM
jgi:hypothetical protein